MNAKLNSIKQESFSHLLKKLVMLLSGAILFLPVASYANLQSSMVKVFTTATTYDYDTPWQTSGIENFTGSGCIIPNKQILTNAHVVSNATFIEVQRNGNPNKFTATVLSISHDADLALLQVEDDTFFKDTTPLEFGGLPDLSDEVFVFGFPEGGEGLSVTKGIVSRIEVTRYSHSFLPFLSLQIDAAINSGNSGGPVIMNGKIIGIAMQAIKKAENIGYIIPVPIIEHFLTDIKDGHYDGFPEAGITFQGLRNPVLRESLKLPDSVTGVYIDHVIPGTSADGLIFPGDVLLSVDKHQVANDETVPVRPGLRVKLNYYIYAHQIGENIMVAVWRNGSRQRITIPLKTKLGESHLVKLPMYDRQPEYYILAGIIFSPLSFNYLTTWDDDISKAPNNLLRYLYKFREEAHEQVVIISGLLPSKMTTGYEDVVDKRVVSINGQGFTDFISFTRLIDNALTKDKFITLKTEDHNVIVVSPQIHKSNEKKLLKLYNIDRPYHVEE